MVLLERHSSLHSPGHWTSWGVWSQCSASCGKSTKIRTRKCHHGGSIPSQHCIGTTTQVTTCHLKLCEERINTERHLVEQNKLDLPLTDDYISSKKHRIKSEHEIQDVIRKKETHKVTDDLTSENGAVTFTPNMEPGTPAHLPEATVGNIQTERPYTTFPNWFVNLTRGLAAVSESPGKPVYNNHEFRETCHSVTFYFLKKNDSKGCCDTTMSESIHTKDESKRGSAFAFIFGVN